MNLKGFYMQKIFLTFFYVGLIKYAPGTFGSIFGAIFGFFIYQISAFTLFLASILLFLVSINIINNYEAKAQIHDPKFIVIDEVAGVWLAMSICGQSIIAMILSLIFFRIFDITKPSFIGKIDKNIKGGLGVMGDDMAAGAVAGVFGAIFYNILLKFEWFINLDQTIQI